MATSVGVLATLATLVVVKGWSAHWMGSLLPALLGVLAAAGAAAWWLRVQWVGPRGMLPGLSTTPATASRQRSAAPVSPLTVVKLPAGFEREALLHDLRASFLAMQSAWDLGDVAALAGLTTPEMLAELLQERGLCAVGADAVVSVGTDVVTLRAELIGFEALPEAHIISVEFSGLIREDADRGAVPFRELWMLMLAKHGTGGWRLARHQVLL